jgi:hypothetical protein
MLEIVILNRFLQSSCKCTGNNLTVIEQTNGYSTPGHNLNLSIKVMNNQRTVTSLKYDCIHYSNSLSLKKIQIDPFNHLKMHPRILSTINS